MLQFVGIDGIVELSENWGMLVFKGDIKLFSVLILSHKLSMTNSVDMCAK